MRSTTDAKLQTSLTSARHLLAALALLAAAPLAASCAATPAEEDDAAAETDGPEPEDRGDAVSGGTVEQAAASSCATSSVRGLSLQIIEEGNCIEPGAFAAVPAQPNLVIGSNVFAFLEQPARDQLVAALQANPTRTLTVNSMLRTVAQQYMLYSWYQSGRCGISLAAKPGNSNHETGLAMDIQEYSAWRTALSNRGFQWFGSSDVWHYDYVGAGAVSHKGLDVKAFQRLWNRNHPEDKIAEDGAWGPMTADRMRRSPAAGFPIGAQCEGATSECNATFKDICGSPYEADIEWLAAEGYTSGCDPVEQLYCPDADLTREQMAGFLAAALELPPGPDEFTDDESSPFEAAINAIAAAGITAGCDAAGTQFCPTGTVTRGQMATFLARAFHLPPGPDAFVDDDGSVHEDSINRIAAAGITAGCDAVNHLFCPDAKVSRGQVATFLHRAMD